jgi:hypothetical protein
MNRLEQRNQSATPGELSVAIFSGRILCFAAKTPQRRSHLSWTRYPAAMAPPSTP